MKYRRRFEARALALGSIGQRIYKHLWTRCLRRCLRWGYVSLLLVGEWDGGDTRLDLSSGNVMVQATSRSCSL